MFFLIRIFSWIISCILEVLGCLICCLSLFRSPVITSSLKIQIIAGQLLECAFSLWSTWLYSEFQITLPSAMSHVYTLELVYAQNESLNSEKNHASKKKCVIYFLLQLNCYCTRLRPSRSITPTNVTTS